MKYVDLHSDYLYKYYKDGECSVYQSNLQQLIKGDCLLQTFAVLFNRAEIGDINRCYRDFLKLFNNFIFQNRFKIGFAKSYQDILENQKNNKISALLSLEDSQILCESGDNVQNLYDDGVRMAAILWNGENDIGFSYKENKPLKPLGIEIIKKMENTGIILDVSHLSDKGLDDVIRIAGKPFLASHSNARTLTCHRRNLTDEQIKILANKGGIIGINFYSKYIDLTRIDDYSESKVEYLLAHIKHLIKHGGEDCVVFGQDFDGVPIESIEKSDIKDATYMPYLYQKLSESLADKVLEKVFYKNALNFFRENL